MPPFSDSGPCGVANVLAGTDILNLTPRTTAYNLCIELIPAYPIPTGPSVLNHYQQYGNIMVGTTDIFLNQADTHRQTPSSILINQEVDYVKEEIDDRAGPKTLALMLCVSGNEVQRRIQVYIGNGMCNDVEPTNRL